MLPVRSTIARDNSRIACWPFVSEYKLHKQAIQRRNPAKAGHGFCHNAQSLHEPASEVVAERSHLTPLEFLWQESLASRLMRMQ
jgi:hypothetical protein